MIPIAKLVELLDQADELETAKRVALQHGLPSVAELLERRPAHSLEARAMGDLYVAMQARWHSVGRIATLTGRSLSTVYQTLRARTDTAYRERRRLQQKVAWALRESGS